MNWDLLSCLIFFLVLVVYLTQLPKYRLDAFGNFLKKVFSIFPLKQCVEAILSVLRLKLMRKNKD